MLTALCIFTGLSLSCILIGLFLKDYKRRIWHKKATHQPFSKKTYEDLMDEINMIN